MPENDDISKQLKVEGRVHSDADFMAAIDAQMEALARRRRGRKPVVKEEAAAETSGVTIAARSDKVSEATVAPPPPVQKEELRLSHKAADVQPLNLARSEEKAEQPSPAPEAVFKQTEPVRPEISSPKVMDVMVKPKITVTSEPERVPVAEPTSSTETPDLSHPEGEPTASPEAPEKQEDISAPKLNTEKLASQVRRDPRLETTSADVPEEEPIRELTTEYHLPIHQSHIKRHRPPVNTLLAIALFLLLAVFIAVIAIDMELIDVDIRLPFDFF